MMRPSLLLPTSAVLAMLAGALPCAGASTAASGKDAPRAEIQIALCGTPNAIERALDLRPRGAPYETWLFDDKSLTLLGHGVRARLRVKGGRSELTVKVAAQECSRLAPGLVPKGEGKCELDLHGERLEGAVSLTRRLDARATKALLSGAIPVAQVLSESQRRYLREVKRIDPLPADLRPLGPIANRVLETPDRAYDIDASQLPGGQTYVEISAKVAPAEVDTTRRRLVARLADAGVAMCTDQAGQAAVKMKILLQRP